MTLEGELRGLPRDIRKRLEAVDAWRAWDVSDAGYGARAFAVGAERVYLLGSDRRVSLAGLWSEVEELSFPTPLQMRVVMTGQEPQLVALKQRRHRDEVLGAIPPSHRERLGLDDLAHLAVPPPTAPPTSSPRPSSGRSATSAALLDSGADPQSTLWGLLGAGLAMEVVGGIMLGVSWPDAEESVSTTGVVLGWLLSSAGALPLLVALIGFGTSLGIRAARAL